MLQHLPHTPGINKNWHQPNFSVAKLQPFSVKNLCLKKDLCFNTLEPIVLIPTPPQSQKKLGYKCIIKYTHKNAQRFLHVFKRKKTPPRNPSLLRKEGHSRHGVRFGRRGSAGAERVVGAPSWEARTSEGPGCHQKNHVWDKDICFFGGGWLVEDF